MNQAPLMQPAARSPKRWWGVWALLLIVTVAYVDRVNMAVLVVDPAFLDAFGLAGHRAEQGALMSLFLVGYGMAAFFLTPYYEARLGYRRGLFVSMIVWALLTAASPLAGSLFALLVVRVLLGASEGPLFSLKVMFVRDHFADAERGKPNAVTSMGVSLGLAVGFPLVGALLHAFGWAASFHVLALINLVVGVPLVYAFIRPPVAAATRVTQPPALRDVVAGALRMRHLGTVIAIEVCTLAYLWGSSSWLPAYLVDDKGFSLHQMGIMASLPFLIGIGANFLGGAFVDRLGARNMAFVFVGGGLGCAASVLALIESHATGATLFFLLTASACWGIQGAAIPTLVQRFSPAASVGSAYGLVNGVGNLVSALMPMAMGSLMKAHVSSGFILLVATQVLVALCGLRMVHMCRIDFSKRVAAQPQAIGG